MNKNLMLTIITGIIVGAIYYFFVSANLVEATAFTLVFMILYASLEVILNQTRKKKALVAAVAVDLAEVWAFMEAIGGQSNIAFASHEVSRVKVSLKDVDLIDQAKLKALKLEGAFLSGEHLQVTFGKRAEGVAQQINEQIK